ncbi:MAG: RCC1 domain-containing protein [Actinomycetota bacterium]
MFEHLNAMKTRGEIPVKGSRSRRRVRFGAALAAFVLAGTSMAAVRADQNEGGTVAIAAAQGHIAVGGLHTCAVLQGGAVQCWGGNDSGQLGNGTTTAATAPTTVSGIANATAVTAGNTHTCALISGGTVKCWGLDASGQLGDNTTGDPAQQQQWRTPRQVVASTASSAPALTGVTAVAAGGFHTCAIYTDTGTSPAQQKVKCWGDDGIGQLGDGTPGDKSQVPTLVPGLTNVLAVAAGEFHTCALYNDTSVSPAVARVKCWGHNGFGQLGDGTKTDRPAPVSVAGLPDPVADPNKAPVAITAGYGHSCVLLKDSTAWCWGQNAYGQLGHATNTTTDNQGVKTMDPSPTPLAVQYDADPTPITNPQTLSGLVAISAGQFHTCALVNAQVACWGQNGRGQLGTDPDPATKGLQNSTYAVGASGVSGATAVTAGGFHTCASVGGGMKCWGYNFYGQLGHFSPQSLVPVQVTALTGAKVVAAGTGFACALVDTTTPKKPFCWGDNADGRLGANLGTTGNAKIRVPVTGIDTVSAIDVGNGHACALRSAPGPVIWQCWGRNTDGQLGNGSFTSSSVPVDVTGLSGSGSLSAGGGLGSVEQGHTCAVRPDTKVVCWGSNTAGQLGDNSTTNSGSPVVVRIDTDPESGSDHVSLSDLTNATAVATGGFHSCALTSDGKVYCWGSNGDGQLGDDTTDSRAYGMDVQTDTNHDEDHPLTDVVAIGAGTAHTCAILGSGKVQCWGDNSSNQIGDATASDRHLPTTVKADNDPSPAVSIGDLSGASVITVGDFHTCVRRNDGSLTCWGANGSGQLGDGSTGNSAVGKYVFGPDPSAVPAALRPVIKSISASRMNTCAVFIDTTVFCWGDNAAGQLGDGVGATSVGPLDVNGLAGPV